ncbi:thioesterase family protein [Ensifer soli]|uniref:thioesterase family protein n=1 Tax=Ciceribacter sp. sgz301302 TaxID=3342379 RepID=UPI0035BB0DE6
MHQETSETVYSATIDDAHVDYNGHMTEAAYAQLFATAAAHLFRRLDLEAAYRRRTGCTMYTVETRIRYLREAHSGTKVTIGYRLLDRSDKRLHLYFEMFGPAGLLATYECISVHVSQREGEAARSTPFGPDHIGIFAKLVAAFEHVPKPDGIGKAPGLAHRGA